MCLFNSFNFDFHRLRRFSRRSRHLVHRVDGPIGAYRGYDDGTDRRILRINHALAAATVFQSRYSLERHLELGLELRAPVVIRNAVDAEIFHPPVSREPLDGRRLRIIATSWSDNPRKGAETIRWLDEHLDPERHELTFVGRSAVRFAHAHEIAPVPSAELAELLRAHDVYIAASRDDPCSNALLEALACGLRRRTCAAAATRSWSATAGWIRRGGGADRRARAASGRARRPPCGDPRGAARGDRRSLPRGPPRMIGRSAAGRLVRAPAAAARRLAVAAGTRGWPPSSRLFVVGDRSGWSIDDDVVHVSAAARRLGFEVGPAPWAPYARRQSVFLPSHFSALSPRWLGSSHRLGLAYFHGRPGTAGHPEFDTALETLRRHAQRVQRVQVTHAEMQELVVTAGVDPGRVFRIPIGIDLELFPPRDGESLIAARRSLGLGRDAFVVGSFQKDGVGWGEGLQPKPVKGPDVLVAVLERVYERVPELVVLLTGPARGYVRAGLERRGIPYRHVRIDTRSGLAGAYHALDAYLVASRQEGGPKSVLESLATGVPLVSTRVGQAPEIVEDDRTGLLADVDDVEALAGLVVRVHEDAGLASRLGEAGRKTARAYAYPMLDPRWAELLAGFVDVPTAAGRASRRRDP